MKLANRISGAETLRNPIQNLWFYFAVKAHIIL